MFPVCFNFTMPKILIAEDEPKIAGLLEKRFRRNGFTSMVAADGEQVIQAAQMDNYAVILLDLGLPLKNGWAVLKELREQGNKCPVIVVTALDVSLKEVLAAGANGLVPKPFKFQDLLAAVKEQTEPPGLLEIQTGILEYKCS